jgi:hypothetical protein
LSDNVLVKFIVASSGGQVVAVNPKFVRCLFASVPSSSYRGVAIDIGEAEHPIKVDGDLEQVASLDYASRVGGGSLSD